MTESDIATVIGILKVAYPHYYKEKADLMNATQLWHEMFQGDDIELIKLAVKSYIASNTNGFPPTIGQIKERIYKLTDRNASRTAIEAWDEAYKMLCNGIYMTEEEFDSHSEDVKSVFGSVAQVRDMAQLDTDVTNSVTKGQFLKQYEVIKERDREQKLLPTQMQDMVKQLAEKLSIGG